MERRVVIAELVSVRLFRVTNSPFMKNISDDSRTLTTFSNALFSHSMLRPTKEGLYSLINPGVKY